MERGEQRVRASLRTYETHALNQAVLEAAGASKTCRVTRRAAFFFTSGELAHTHTHTHTHETCRVIRRAALFLLVVS